MSPFKAPRRDLARKHSTRSTRLRMNTIRVVVGTAILALTSVVGFSALQSASGPNETRFTPTPAAGVSSAATPLRNSPSAATPRVIPNSAMPIGNVVSNGRTWTQSYAENFNTPAALGTVLSTYPELKAYAGFRDTSGKGLYAPDKVLSVANGNLDFDLHSENGQPLVATVLPDDYAPHMTGRFEMRFKADSIVGYKFVAMFWPENNDFNDGEIDWPEGNLTGAIFASSKVPGTAATGVKQYITPQRAVDLSDYHTTTIEWDKSEVRFYLDGRQIGSTSVLPTTPMRVTLQAETTIGKSAVPPSASGHIDIDWISIWN